ncbi:MAG: hypothetical protein IJN85_06065 [Oscillospiraceae bacterium]|nr:hypothetical protein [Oscillospiraceae bacterium]
MKKIIIISTFIFTILLCGCNERGILKGYTGMSGFSSESFGDYTDYSKYTYNESGEKRFEESELYSEVTSEDIENIKSYFDNFRKWAEAIDRLDDFDFDNSLITEGDFFFIETKEGEKISDTVYEKFDNYSVYLYDSETDILFYIHNNL